MKLRLTIHEGEPAHTGELNVDDLLFGPGDPAAFTVVDTGNEVLAVSTKPLEFYVYEEEDGELYAKLVSPHEVSPPYTVELVQE